MGTNSVISVLHSALPVHRGESLDDRALATCGLP